MVKHIKPPYLPYDDIRPKASQFLESHNPERIIPVPIEDIVEKDLGIFISVIPDLELLHGIDSFIEMDGKTLSIDEGVFGFRPRCRFSYAHEIGHLSLHFGNAPFSTTEEFVEYRVNLDKKGDYWFEIQAYNFAGLILVPPDELHDYFCEGIEISAERGFDAYESPDKFLERILPWLAKRFDVTEHVIKKRIGFDKLWEVI